MKSNLHLKFGILYLIFGFLSIFIVSVLGSPLVASQLRNQESSSIYQEANVLATDYLTRYFTEEISYFDVETQLDGMSAYLHCAIWFVDNEGNLLLSSNAKQNNTVRYIPSAIEDFNPAEAGSERYLVGTYHGYFKEDVMTVLAPVTKGFSTLGYLIIHKPASDITQQHDGIMYTIYITVFVIYLVSFLILLGIQGFVYLPLRKITEAATQYASGNLDYEIPVNSEDEIGYLSASLNYMSSHLKDMEDYQKKFVANVSHDFRSPLTSIKGYVEAMADGTIPPQLQGKYLNIILFETERLTDLTADLLTLNEFDTKNLLLNKEVLNIHEIIKHVAASFEGRCTEKKISIELLFATKELFVTADRRKIEQVLYNLLDNAIKFSNPDSGITLETTTKGEKVFVSVKDYGIGIPKKSLTKIWERFYKTDLSRGKDKKGTGLGLAIVKEIIQAHGENVNVISTEGVGTEFIFSLPKASPSGTAKK